MSLSHREAISGGVFSRVHGMRNNLVLKVHYLLGFCEDDEKGLMVALWGCLLWMDFFICT